MTTEGPDLTPQKVSTLCHEFKIFALTLNASLFLLKIHVFFNLTSQVLLSDVGDIFVDKGFTKNIRAALISLMSGQRHLKYLQ